MNALTRHLAAHRRVAAVCAGVLLLAGVALYPSLPDQMAIHFDASGTADNYAPKPVAVALMPAVVVGMSLLFSVTNVDREEAIVGSLAMLLLVAVQFMVFGANLGVSFPIVPISLGMAAVLVAVAFWFEFR
jgi:uncharacterized membrane protein